MKSFLTGIFNTQISNPKTKNILNSFPFTLSIGQEDTGCCILKRKEIKSDLNVGYTTKWRSEYASSYSTNESIVISLTYHAFKYYLSCKFSCSKLTNVNSKIKINVNHYVIRVTKNNIKLLFTSFYSPTNRTVISMPSAGLTIKKYTQQHKKGITLEPKEAIKINFTLYRHYA
jgi:hypothetical protein